MKLSTQCQGNKSFCAPSSWRYNITGCKHSSESSTIHTHAHTHLHSSKLGDAGGVDGVLGDGNHHSAGLLGVHAHVEDCLDALRGSVQQVELGGVRWILGAIPFGDEVGHVLSYH